MKRLLIVIVSHNSKDCLEACLDSVERETDLAAIQIVVVDNASEDEDFSDLQRRFPRVRFIFNRLNLGFATACNQGISSQPAQFYLLLNPDTVILDRAIDRVLEFMERTPDAGIAGCRVENPDGSLQRASRRSIPTLSNSFYRLSGLAWLFPNHPRLGGYNLGHLDAAQTQRVEAVSGSFLMFRHALLVQTGGLDQRFFLYGEDLDFCLQSLQKGWGNYYFPGARVLHRKYQSSRRSLAFTTYHFYNAMKIFYDKHYGGQHGQLLRRGVHASIDLLHLLRRVHQRLFRRRGPGTIG